jgi:hypothetical protein
MFDSLQLVCSSRRLLNRDYCAPVAQQRLDRQPVSPFSAAVVAVEGLLRTSVWLPAVSLLELCGSPLAWRQAPLELLEWRCYLRTVVSMKSQSRQPVPITSTSEQQAWQRRSNTMCDQGVHV